MQLNTYATLSAFRQRQALAASDTGDDDRMLAKLRSATAQIDRFTGRSFIPTVATRRFNWHNARTLLFRGFDLLELTSITNGDGTAIDPTAIITLGGVNGPLVGVELDVTRAFFVYLTTRTRALAVAGVWGWHDDYGNAWKPSTDSIPGGGITSSATSFTVASVSGADGWSLSPRFTPGQLLKVDSEYMHVVGANTGTNTLTVVRGANGSTAASHTAGTAISVYVPPTDIAEVTLRWAGWLYKTEDAGDYSGSVALPGEANILAPVNVPPAIPSDLLVALVNLRRVVGAL
jgi:hypothetical protein